MTDFETAARKAATKIVFEMPDSPHPEDRGAFADAAIREAFADLAETFKKLVWVAYLADHYIASIRQDFYEEDKDSAWVDLTTAVADPAIAALLAEKG